MAKVVVSIGVDLGVFVLIRDQSGETVRVISEEYDVLATYRKRSPVSITLRNATLRFPEDSMRSAHVMWGLGSESGK